jgi:hypothetical protein
VTMTTKESLDHFRTVAFGLEVMRKMIGRSRENISSVDAAAWFEGMVPKCYRPAVTACMQRVLERHVGKKLTDGAVYELVVDLNGEISRTVAPIIPGAGEVEFSPEPAVANVNANVNEVADIEERLKLLRAASRPSEPMDTWEYADNGARDYTPTAQGHILSAITQLERRRAELLGKAKP